jgi:hypothetical protein
MFDNFAIETYHLRLPLFESGRKGGHGEGQESCREDGLEGRQG